VRRVAQAIAHYGAGNDNNKILAFRLKNLQFAKLLMFYFMVFEQVFTYFLMSWDLLQLQ